MVVLGAHGIHGLLGGLKGHQLRWFLQRTGPHPLPYAWALSRAVVLRWLGHVVRHAWSQNKVPEVASGLVHWAEVMNVHTPGQQMIHY